MSVPERSTKVESSADPHRRWELQGRSSLLQYAIAVGAVAAVSLINVFLEPLAGIHSTALTFLLAVVVLALFVDRGPTLAAATLSAAVWDYYFLPPAFAFRVTHFEDGMLLAMYFAVALVLGELTSRIRAQEKARREGEQRATALYLLARELAGAASVDETLQTGAQQLKRLFKAEVALQLSESPDRLEPQTHSASTFSLSEKDERLATWTFKHGCSTRDETVEPASYHTLFLPLATGDCKLGVAILRFNASASVGVHLRNLLDAFVQQISLALERHRLQEESERAKLLAESERLSKTMLNSMSHEIRTPIAAIKGATSNLVEIQEPVLSQTQHAMIGEIQEATERLDRLVGKVLDITRLESGWVKPKLTLCDVRDLIHMSVKETRRELARHRISVEIAPALPLVLMDFVLMQQALTNLLSNAAFHTPVGTAVRLTASAVNGTVVFVVQDEGPGIPAESLPRIFDKFYRGPAAPTGGTGLGLSLVKGLVEAQGGQVWAENRAGSGATFTIRLPLNKMGADQNGANV
jgi:two-component system sensor histidine kinase KdpD